MVTQAAAGPVHRPNRVRFARAFCRAVTHLLFDVRVEGAERWSTGPAIYCFNHLGWTDPIFLMGVLPLRPRYAMFGPKEADMTVGGRNRLISWLGFGIPYRPTKDDLIEATRRVQRVLDDGWVVAIAGEGRIHRGERELLPLADGVAYFALRAGVPVIPIAINGTSWLGLRRRVRIRVGDPIMVPGRPTREHIAELSRRTEDALLAMVADFPDPGVPGPFGRWITELFNDWPEGARPELGAGDGAGTDLAGRQARVGRPDAVG